MSNLTPLEEKRLERLRNLLSPLCNLPDMIVNNTGGVFDSLILKTAEKSKEVLPMILKALESNITLSELNQLYTDPLNRVIEYKKDNEDHYDYIGICYEDFSKYYEVNKSYFHMLIKPITIARMFGDSLLDCQYFTYRDHLILRMDDINYKFKFEHDFDFPEISEIEKDLFKFWYGSTTSKDNNKKDYYIYLETYGDKIRFNDTEAKDLIEPTPYDGGFTYVSVRTLQIQEEIINEMNPEEFRNYVKSHNTKLKFKL